MIVWKLDELMRGRRVKGRELARRMGIGENYLSRVRHEVPDRLSLELLDGLCRELDCTLSDLLEYRPGPAAATAQPAGGEAPRLAAPVAREAAIARPQQPVLREAQPAPSPVVAEPAPPPVVTIAAPVINAPAAHEPSAAPVVPVVVAAEPVAPPAAAEAPRAPAEEAPAEAGAAYVKIGALQARLNRLKHRQ